MTIPFVITGISSRLLGQGERGRPKGNFLFH
jgi:type IV secretory pathway VirB10-like protein